MSADVVPIVLQEQSPEVQPDEGDKQKRVTFKTEGRQAVLNQGRMSEKVSLPSDAVRKTVAAARKSNQGMLPDCMAASWKTNERTLELFFGSSHSRA